LVNDHVAWPCVEREHRFRARSCRNGGQVGNASYVERNAIDRRVPEQEEIRKRDEGSAMPSGCNVRWPEVGDYGLPDDTGDAGRLAYLHRAGHSEAEQPRRVALVVDGLAVRSHEVQRLCGHASVLARFDHRLPEQPAKQEIELADSRRGHNRVGRTENLLSNAWRKRNLVETYEIDFQREPFASDLDKRDINGID
jgi:hypothetical protein